MTIDQYAIQRTEWLIKEIQLLKASMNHKRNRFRSSLHRTLYCHYLVVKDRRAHQALLEADQLFNSLEWD